MDNLGIMLAVTLRGNEILPCIRILRGIDTATRQYLDNVVVYAHLIKGPR